MEETLNQVVPFGNILIEHCNYWGPIKGFNHRATGAGFLSSTVLRGIRRLLTKVVLNCLLNMKLTASRVGIQPCEMHPN